MGVLGVAEIQVNPADVSKMKSYMEEIFPDTPGQIYSHKERPKLCNWPVFDL